MNRDQNTQETETATNHHAREVLHEVESAGKRLGLHLLAIVGGVVLMVLALGMMFTVVLAPVAIPLGIVGIVITIWGIFDWSIT